MTFSLMNFSNVSFPVGEDEEERPLRLVLAGLRKQSLHLVLKLHSRQCLVRIVATFSDMNEIDGVFDFVFFRNVIRKVHVNAAWLMASTLRRLICLD